MNQLLVQYTLVGLNLNDSDDMKLCKSLESSEFWMQTVVRSTATFKSINFVLGSPEFDRFKEECNNIGINF